MRRFNSLKCLKRKKWYWSSKLAPWLGEYWVASVNSQGLKILQDLKYKASQKDTKFPDCIAPIRRLVCRNVGAIGNFIRVPFVIRVRLYITYWFSSLFTVHGNHDNPVGEFSASAVDTLVSLGLVSHFGRIQNNDKILIQPVSLKKGSTIINIWGFGSLKDERLNALIQVRLYLFGTRSKCIFVGWQSALSSTRKARRTF